MHPINALKKEHSILKKKIDSISKMFEIIADRLTISKTLNDFEFFWNNHEENEEKFFDKFVEYRRFIGGKMIIGKHRQLKGHWKVIKDYLQKSDDDLRVALDTDGMMVLNKFREHLKMEEECIKGIWK